MLQCIRHIALLAAVPLSAFLVSSTTAHAAECDALLDKADQVSILTKQSQLYKQAQEKCPKNALANYKYAFSLERLRKYDAALKYYNEAARLDKNSAKYLFGVADALRMTNNIQGAVEAYQQGLKLQPNNVRAKKSLHVMLEKLAAMEPPKKPTPPPPPPSPPSKITQVKKEEVKKKKIEVTIHFTTPPDQKLDMPFSASPHKGIQKYFHILKDKQADDKKNWH